MMADSRRTVHSLYLSVQLNSQSTLPTSTNQTRIRQIDRHIHIIFKKEKEKYLILPVCEPSKKLSPSRTPLAASENPQ